jgi:hypothetical protein
VAGGAQPHGRRQADDAAADHDHVRHVVIVS